MALLPWKTISSKYVFDDPWLKIRADCCRTAKGAILDPFYIQEPPDWTHVVGFDDQDNILTIRQYRHGSKSISVELPCGGVEPGEDPRDAARRELLEETGCTAAVIEPLPPFSPNPARYSNKVYPFLALGVRQVTQPQIDHTEEIEFEFVSIPEVLALIESGKMQQPIHSTSVYGALRKRGLLALVGDQDLRSEKRA